MKTGHDPQIAPELRARFPLIEAEGAALLKRLEEHPHAPRYTHPGVNRLSASVVARAAGFAAEIAQSPPAWEAGEHPGWVPDFVSYCYRQVPLYRRRGGAPDRFFDLPTTDRSDLARAPWAFVPDDVPVEAGSGLTVYNTSGTTGHPLSILTNADTLALYLPLMRAALATQGVTLEGGPGRVAMVLVAYQKRTYTYAAVSALLGQAGFVKVNLSPAEWRAPEDRARFLDDCAPEVLTGDPIAFAELAQLPLAVRPKALISTAMMLTPGLRQALAARFGCPVLDVYSTNESGPIAVRRDDDTETDHERWTTEVLRPSSREAILLQPRLFVEILDASGWPCPPGVRGEVVLTGGFNPFLPLLRYRTHDYARMMWDGARPRLVDLEGRAPVLFRAVDGRRINNIDVSLALRHLPLAQFTLHQAADGSLRLRVRQAGVPHATLREILLGLFGAGQRLDIEELEEPDAPNGKRAQYTSELM